MKPFLPLSFQLLEFASRFWIFKVLSGRKVKALTQVWREKNFSNSLRAKHRSMWKWSTMKKCDAQQIHGAEGSVSFDLHFLTLWHKQRVHPHLFTCFMSETTLLKLFIYWITLRYGCVGIGQREWAGKCVHLCIVSTSILMCLSFVISGGFPERQRPAELSSTIPN